jgi:phage terminase small subunit
MASKSRNKLTPKQEMFCREYLIDLNATQAAIRAGYSSKTAGQIGERLLKKVETQHRIQELQAKRSEKTDITAERVLSEYAKLAFTDLPGIVTFNGVSMSVADFDTLTPEQRACIKKFRVKTETKMIAGNPTPVDVVEVELHSKQAALDSIAKHLGMFVERKILQNPDGTPLMQPTGKTRQQIVDEAREWGISAEEIGLGDGEG